MMTSDGLNDRQAREPAAGFDPGLDSRATVDSTATHGVTMLSLDQRWSRARRRRDPAPTHGHAEARTFDPEEIAVLTRAFEEACAFLRQVRPLGPAKRHEIAHVILSHAQRGPLDAHRLALKAIVHVA